MVSGNSKSQILNKSQISNHRPEAGNPKSQIPNLNWILGRAPSAHKSQPQQDFSSRTFTNFPAVLSSAFSGNSLLHEALSISRRFGSPIAMSFLVRDGPEGTLKVLEGPLPGESKRRGFAEMARETSEAPTRIRLLAKLLSMPPLQGSHLSLNPFQGLTPLAISWRPFGAPEVVPVQLVSHHDRHKLQRLRNVGGTCAKAPQVPNSSIPIISPTVGRPVG